MEVTEEGAHSALRGTPTRGSLAHSCAAASNAAVESARIQQHSLADLQAPEIAYEVKAAPAKKRGAVIGSAAKLSSEGLMAAAKLARQKEEQKLAQVSSTAMLPASPSPRFTPYWVHVHG